VQGSWLVQDTVDTSLCLLNASMCLLHGQPVLEKLLAFTLYSHLYSINAHSGGVRSHQALVRSSMQINAVYRCVPPK